MKKIWFYSAALLLAAVVFVTTACQKTYTLAPLSPDAFTPTFTSTSTPCGYPGFTCTFTATATFTPTFTSTNTWTFTYTPTITFTPTNTATPTWTGTPTNSPTITWTPTITNTPALLQPPQGPLGYINSAGQPEVLFKVDTDPRVTNYKIYYGNSSGGPFTYVGSVPKAAAELESINLTITTFNIYIYIVAAGTIADSVPSRMVHAVSGTVLTSSLTITASAITPLVFTVSGSVPGAVKRLWEIPFSPPTFYWEWGDEGPPLANPVTYGTSTGLTYVHPGPLPSPGTSMTVTVTSYNSENWRIDSSALVFSAPN